MEVNDESGDEPSTADEGQFNDEEPDLSMVLALLLRNGQVRLTSAGGIQPYGDDSDESDSCSATENPHDNLQEPDSMADSDLMQDILLCSGRLKTSKNRVHSSEPILNALRNREISCCGAARKSVFTAGCKRAISSRQIPNQVENTVRLRERIFCGIFSGDGNSFLSACQDGYLRVYDAGKLKNGLKQCQPFKTIPAINVGWSILDVAFSPDAYYLAYSTWSSDLHLASIYDNDDSSLASHIAMNLEPEHPSFAAFSIQFSSDNNEILSGANDGHLYIYDRNLGKRTLRINAQEDDVNAVCYADSASDILFSGGDDGLVNVWDRRSLSETNPQAVGTFAGHLDGITFLDTKGDTRYLLSNSKDQTVKVWDMRKPSGSEAQDAVRSAVSHQSWDYRWQQVPRRQRSRKKTVFGDTSIKTYHGHVVTNTLIRARFSPMHSTGQKYIYCGCAKGNVVVYDILTGEILSKEKEHKHCVRDVSWHPYEPTLISSSWDSSFIVWNYETDGNMQSCSSKLSRKRRHKTRGCCNSDSEDDAPAPNRRSPRLARSAYR